MGKNRITLMIDEKHELSANCTFWMDYEYEDEGYPLFFIELPNLCDRHIVQLLKVFDGFYGDTDQETTEWALEYQLLTRLLITEKMLLVNPKYLDLSDENVIHAVLDAGTDEHIYLSARALSQGDILKAYEKYSFGN